jgi:radical SAM superfamily enzyme YgiQ (UPF0313 family)
MRVLLVNPFYPITEMPSPPLGLAYLAAALERDQIDVRILDLVVNAYTRKNLESVLADFKPDVVGATSVTMSFDSAIGVLKDAKAIDPEMVTMMGGPHITFCAEETMRAFPQLDLVVLGEGEVTAVEVVRALEGARKLDSVRGIVFRDQDTVRRTEPRPDPVDVNSLPLPARHLLPLRRYRALGMAISMTTSRGCPFQCIFCVGRKMVGAKVRYRNPQGVVDEMEYLNTLDFPQINVADDLFILNKRHCLGICDEIIARDMKVKWTSFARADTVSVEVLRRMKEAGCTTISFGFESANPEILETIKKGITVEQILAAAEMCREAGMGAQASFILGLPGETPETIQETVDLCKRLEDLEVASGFHVLAPFPGTRIREKSEEYGIRILTDDWRQYHANRAIVETPEVTPGMIDRIVIDYEEKVMEEIGEMVKRTERNMATEQERRTVTNLDHMAIYYEMIMNEVLENGGSWTGASDAASREVFLGRIADRMAGSTIYPRSKIVDALTYAMEAGVLRNRERDGAQRLEWVDNI